MNGYELNGWISIPGRGKDFSLCYHISSSSGAHPAFYLMGTGGSIPGGKAAGE